jgi:hypothetical protein
MAVSICFNDRNVADTRGEGGLYPFQITLKGGEVDFGPAAQWRGCEFPGNS